MFFLVNCLLDIEILNLNVYNNSIVTDNGENFNMRMRKKKNFDARFLSCSEFIVENPDDIRNKPVFLEIGCGKGKFISGLAARYPDRSLIAMEKVVDVAITAMEKIREEEITNVRFLLKDAVELNDYFQKGDVERIYLNFSDPWPKGRHYKRRLTYRRFLEIYKSVLPDNGEIYFKTDKRDFFDFSLEEFAASGFKLRNITYDLHNSEFAQDNIETEYERKFSALGSKINRVEAYLE